MLGFNETITIYNRWYDEKARKDHWQKTIIHGASWAGGQKVILGEGRTSNDGYSVRIPEDAFPEGFLLKHDYLTTADKEGKWTAQNGDLVVLGEGPDIVKNHQEAIKATPASFTINAVHVDNLKRPLPHLRLEGV